MSTDSFELTSLLGRIVNQDERALDQFYELTVDHVYALASKIVRDDGVVEEVISDVYFQVWKKAGSFDIERGNVMAWLMVQCRSRAIDTLRRLKRHSNFDSLDVSGDIESENPSIEDLLESLEQGSQVRAALEVLTPVQRQVIALAYYRGLSHSELADRLDIPIGTVKSHLRRALRRLEKELTIESDADNVVDISRSNVAT